MAMIRPCKIHFICLIDIHAGTFFVINTSIGALIQGPAELEKSLA